MVGVLGLGIGFWADGFVEEGETGGNDLVAEARADPAGRRERVGAVRAKGLAVPGPPAEDGGGGFKADGEEGEGAEVLRALVSDQVIGGAAVRIGVGDGFGDDRR